MKRIYILTTAIIVLFTLSIDIIIYTNIFLDLLFVVLFVMLIAQAALLLGSDINEIEGDYILREKETTYFSPLIYALFLSTSYNLGIIPFIINILVIIIIFIYVLFTMKRNEIVISKDKVSVTYLNNKKTSIEFSKVTKVEFNWFYNYLGLIDEFNNKVILDITLRDFIVVIKMIKDNLEEEIYQDAFKKLSRFYNIFLLRLNNKYL